MGIPTHWCSHWCTHWYTSDLSRLKVLDQPGPLVFAETIDHERDDKDGLYFSRIFAEPVAPDRPSPTRPALSTLPFPLAKPYRELVTRQSTWLHGGGCSHKNRMFYNKNKKPRDGEDSLSLHFPLGVLASLNQGKNNAAWICLNAPAPKYVVKSKRGETN